MTKLVKLLFFMCLISASMSLFAGKDLEIQIVFNFQLKNYFRLIKYDKETTTVADIKNQVGESIGFKASEHILLYNGQKVEDDQLFNGIIAQTAILIVNKEVYERSKANKKSH